MDLFIYSLKRIGTALLTLLLVAAITFFLMNAIPGSPFMTDKSTPEQIALANAKYGLDKPLVVQFVNYVKNLLHGDMGTSLKMQQDTAVTKILFTQGKFGRSIRLGVLALLTAIIVGIPLGCLSAYYRGKWIDNILRVVTTVGVAMPSFVIATLMLFTFGVNLKILPVQSGTLDSPVSYIMPVITMALYPSCHIAKLTRTSMLDSISQDYIRTARAKGLKTKMILFKHALRNSLIPVITYLGPLTASIITGSLVVEQIYSIPGIGSYFVSSILNRDYPIIMGTTILLAALIVFMNLVVDIAYKIVDPRINLTKKGD
ncbi:MAG: ABC transporter permease [Lachnospiraceae bacterium]|nr:ABC transporter permease [Lachnospiraceae bacterium]